MSYREILEKVERVAHGQADQDARMRALSDLYSEVGMTPDLTATQRLDLECRISVYGSDLLRRREHAVA